ncbi:hypothetical protein RRG08_060184 [Elysia crispata]|uniref:Uncharacterized protein n=1 Tax=Elysia crispata TaxID=231223 RepID=A0AAE1DQR3_9GAST|nr:hypothetical protein RRG08_060184 [Elysia crispata]
MGTSGIRAMRGAGIRVPGLFYTRLDCDSLYHCVEIESYGSSKQQTRETITISSGRLVDSSLTGVTATLGRARGSDSPSPTAGMDRGGFPSMRRGKTQPNLGNHSSDQGDWPSVVNSTSCHM